MRVKNSNSTTSISNSSGTRLFRVIRNFVLSVAIWESITFDTKPFRQQLRELQNEQNNNDQNDQNMNDTQSSGTTIDGNNDTVVQELKNWVEGVVEDVTKVVTGANLDFGGDTTSNSENGGSSFEFSVSHLRSLTTLTSTNPVHCYNPKLCCGRWDVNADEWWIHHPHWDVVKMEDVTLTDVGFCFAPTNNKLRTMFLQQLHKLQWGIDIDGDSHIDHSNNQSSTSSSPLPLHVLSAVIPPTYNFTNLQDNPHNAINCSNLVTTVSISSGYGASLSYIYKTFWWAWTEQRPFQIIKRGPWMYATHNQNHSWAYCPDRDFSCLYLPVSPCSRYRNKDINKQHLERRADQRDALQSMQWLWIRDYMTRPRQGFRQALAQLMRPYISQLQHTDCIAMHVRRGDSGVPRPPFRRYAAIQEYLDILPASITTATTRPTIFLLTDDATTIDELYQHHIHNDTTNNPQQSQQQKFHWVYTQKLRNRGTERGFEQHIPHQSDGPEELLWITAELNLAARYCKSLLHGTSGYADQIFDRMRFYSGHFQHNLTRYTLDTRVTRDSIQEYRGRIKARETMLLNNLQSFYNSSKTASANTTTGRR